MTPPALGRTGRAFGAWPLLPLGLAILGAVIPLVGSDFASSGLALAWLAALATVTLGRALARPRPANAVFIDLVLLVAVLTALFPLGGWWFVPAVGVQLLQDRAAAMRP